MVDKTRAALDDLEFKLMLPGEFDASGAIVEISSGAGGIDASDWANMLLRMIMRFCERKGWKVEVVEETPAEEAGIKGATLIVEGDYAFGLLKAEHGVHRLVRVSPFDQQGRRQTSFAAIRVTPDIDDDIKIDINEGDLRIDTYRAGGAGGQHVNKTDSAVRITHLPSGIVVQCQNERSQTSNKLTALRMLKSRLVEQAEEEREAELAKERGQAQDIGFGSQIRSYVLHPYQLVTDHRTDFEVGNILGVLDGDLDGFIREYLLAKAAGRVL